METLSRFSPGCRNASNVSSGTNLQNFKQKCSFFIKFSEIIRTFSDSDDIEHLPQNRELKCYLHCLFVSMNVMSETGVFNIGEMMSQTMDLPDYLGKIVVRMTRGCLKQVAKIPDACNKTYEFHKCLKKNDAEVELNNQHNSH